MAEEDLERRFVWCGAPNARNFSQSSPTSWSTAAVAVALLSKDSHLHWITSPFVFGTHAAKKAVPGMGASPEKSDGENIKYLEVLQHNTEKKGIASNASTEADHEVGRAESRIKESLPHGKSMTEAEDSGLMNKLITSKLDSIPMENGTDTQNVTALGKPEIESGRDTKQQVDQPRLPQPTLARRAEERDRAPRDTTVDVQPVRLLDEGPTDRHQNPSHVYGNGAGGSRQNMDDASKVGYLEQDRAKLLRMLDELRDQVQQTCEASDKKKTSAPVDRMAGSSSCYVQHDHATWFPESSSSSYLNQSRCFPIPHDHNTAMLNFYSNVPIQSDITGYGDPFVHKRVPFHLSSEYPQRQVDSFLYGQFEPDPVMPYYHDGFCHQPACSCLHCYQRPFSVPARAPPTVLGHQRTPYPVNNHEFYAVDGPSIFGTRSSNLRVGNAPLHRLEPRSHCRIKFSKSNAQSCRPIDGAAPFTICSSCFELLQLPEKSLPLKKNKFKLRCGSCFKLMTIQYDGSRIVISAPTPDSHMSSVNNNSSLDSPINGALSTDEKLVLPYIFTINDHEMIEKGHGQHLSESEKMHGFSLSSSTSGHVDSPESVISQKDVPTSPGVPLEAQVISRVSSLPLREHFGYSLSDEAADGSGNGSGSKRSDHVRNLSLSGNFKQNSTKDVLVATERGLSEDEDLPAGLSQDSWDMASKDETQPRVIKAGDSFFAGLIKKSFRPFNQSVGHGRFKVSINNHHVPDRLVKKAEKQAGPIYPGDYWYDYRAGFWGVMGHPCLGIIPPFIEEFNYPMPKNCAGGNTGVLVNGRELHQKDLDLLIGRGLPATRDCSYIIEISGKVWDESSGEEIESLGKLAPTHCDAATRNTHSCSVSHILKRMQRALVCLALAAFRCSSFSFPRLLYSLTFGLRFPCGSHRPLPRPTPLLRRFSCRCSALLWLPEEVHVERGMGMDWEPWPPLQRKSNHVFVKLLVLVLLLGLSFRLLFSRSAVFLPVSESPAAVAETASSTAVVVGVVGDAELRKGSPLTDSAAPVTEVVVEDGEASQQG
ncbi:hypothetical protein MUK42_24976 [Musa troglodytarum]|nr:hypothetical protein MUK42_24976 [Musa troglodytarum]